MQQLMRGILFLFVCVSLVSLVGCGEKIAPVSGTVTCNGEPVTGAMVEFYPIPPEGEVNAATRSAIGQLDENGNYTLSTNAEGDGAWVGRHSVQITPDVEVIETEDDEIEIETKLPGTLAEDYEVEVKSGKNTIDIELEPK
jgi:hypothetical protein